MLHAENVALGVFFTVHGNSLQYQDVLAGDVSSAVQSLSLCQSKFRYFLIIFSQ
jgi:hypothetical protein